MGSRSSCAAVLDPPLQPYAASGSSGHKTLTLNLQLQLYRVHSKALFLLCAAYRTVSGSIYLCQRLDLVLTSHAACRFSLDIADRRTWLMQSCQDRNLNPIPKQVPCLLTAPASSPWMPHRIYLPGTLM